METNRVILTTCFSPNERAWAIGYTTAFRMGKGTKFHIRRVVWGRMMARVEKREGETIRRCAILITGK